MKNSSGFDKGVFDHGGSIRFVTWVGLGLNLLLAAMKFYAGYFDGSQALLADAVHSLSDTFSDVAILIGSYYWSRPADKQHPYGHRRIETIITLLVGLLLVVAGLGIISEAVASFRGGEREVAGGLAASVALVSIVIKEILYRWTRSVGRRVKSPALVANAWHHRTDAFSSIPALIAILGVMIMPAWSFLDQIGALVISVFIFYAAYEIMQAGIKELIDSSASPETCREILKIVRQVAGVEGVHGLRTRFSGSRLYVDLHMLVDGNISVRAGHDIAEIVQRLLVEAELDISDVIVHIEPT